MRNESVAHVHPHTLCLLPELGGRRLIPVAEENTGDGLFRKEGKAAHP